MHQPPPPIRQRARPRALALPVLPWAECAALVIGFALLIAAG